MAQDRATLEINGVVESTIERAVEVIGDRDRALRWMGTPVPSLGYATPISLLGTEAGVTQVLASLGRMEHGVF
jgi:putative toxin-antitoxin system antitoxin component (TIGR02293 family)